jgi:hypothetical protein
LRRLAADSLFSPPHPEVRIDWIGASQSSQKWKLPIAYIGFSNDKSGNLLDMAANLIR